MVNQNYAAFLLLYGDISDKWDENKGDWIDKDAYESFQDYIAGFIDDHKDEIEQDFLDNLIG